MAVLSKCASRFGCLSYSSLPHKVRRSSHTLSVWMPDARRQPSSVCSAYVMRDGRLQINLSIRPIVTSLPLEQLVASNHKLPAAAPTGPPDRRGANVRCLFAGGKE